LAVSFVISSPPAGFAKFANIRTIGQANNAFAVRQRSLTGGSLPQRDARLLPAAPPTGLGDQFAPTA
jgi:hypothetical protein